MNHSFLLQALGWALVNSLWQFGLLWLLFFLSTHFSKKLSSPHKHGLALALTLSGTGWFVFDLMRMYLTDESPASPITGFSPEDFGGYIMLSRLIDSFHDRYLAYATLLYLLVIALQFTRFIYSFYRSHRVYNAGLGKARVDIRMYVQNMAMRLNIKRRVQVFVSEYVDTPLVIGFLKPTILVPLACINHLSMPQLEAILLHELAHIKRNDYLVNVWVASLEIIFFFNPFARMLAHSIRKEREYTCDDWVIQHQFDPHSYASALLTLEKSRTGYLQAGIAAAGASRTILLHRIQRILRVPQREPVSVYRIAAGFFVCVLVWLVTIKPAAKKELACAESSVAVLLASRVPAHKQVQIEPLLPLVTDQTDLTQLSSLPSRKAAKRPAKQDPEPVMTEEDTLFPVSVNNIFSQAPLLQEAVSVEKRNFSIPEEIQPELPAVAQVYSFPYVPSSSFYSTDTLKPIRTEINNEQTADETRLRTQKALSYIDWKAIQKRLPASSRVSIQLVKKRLEQTVNKLNWERINQEVRDSINRQTLKNSRAALYNQYNEMIKWKTQQQYLEGLQKQLQQQQKTYKLETERKSLELQKELSQARIIIYL